MSKVFVLHRVMMTGGIDKYDLTPATDYGDLAVAFIGSEVNNASPDALMERLTTILEDFDRDDSILCIGDPIILFMAGLVLAKLKANAGFKAVRLLRWDRYTKSYNQHMVPLSIGGLTQDSVLG